MLPLEEAQAQLTTVQVAISDLIAGKRLTSLRIGSGNFQREYKYQEISIDALYALRDELMQIIASYTQTLPTFRQHATIPLVVNKDLY